MRIYSTAKKGEFHNACILYYSTKGIFKTTLMSSLKAILTQISQSVDTNFQHSTSNSSH